MFESEGIVRPGWADTAALATLGLVCGGVTLAVGTTRAFPILDDAAYAETAFDLARTGRYMPHDWMVAQAVPHVAWGALFARLFGSTYSVLTAATLVPAAIGVVALYVLARLLGARPLAALAAALLLALDPVYLHLSFSFMSDSTGVLFILLAAIGYTRFLQRAAVGDLWLASLAVAAGALTRQTEILFGAGAVGYLLLGGRLRLGAAALSLGGPLLALAVFAIWERARGAEPLAYLQAMHMVRQSVAHPAYLLSSAVADLFGVLPLVGLLVPLFPRPRARATVALALAVVGGYQAVKYAVHRDAAPFDPTKGNVIDATGYALNLYWGTPQALFAGWVWYAATAFGVASAAWLLAALVEGAVATVDEWRAGSERATARGVVLAGGAALGIGAVLAPYAFDRYALPVIALALACIAATRVGESRRFAAGAGLAALLLGGYGIAAQRDYLCHAGARWRAAEMLRTRGVPAMRIGVGLEWNLVYTYATSVRALGRSTLAGQDLRFPPRYAVMPAWIVSDLPVIGYTVVRRYRYSSILGGFTTRYVLVLHRDARLRDSAL